MHCRPAEVGIDVVCESATKYLNGHSDLIAGVVAGKADFKKKVSHCSLAPCMADRHAICSFLCFCTVAEEITLSQCMPGNSLQMLLQPTGAVIMAQDGLSIEHH